MCLGSVGPLSYDAFGDFLEWLKGRVTVLRGLNRGFAMKQNEFKQKINGRNAEIKLKGD